MPKPVRAVSDYPKSLFDLCQQANETPGGVQLRFPSASEAIRFRMQLYNFRRAVRTAIDEGVISDQWARDIGQLMISIHKHPSGEATLLATTMQQYYAAVGHQLANQQPAGGLSYRHPINIEAAATESLQRIQASLSDGQAIVDTEQEEVSPQDHEEAIKRWLEVSERQDEPERQDEHAIEHAIKDVDS